MAVIKRHAEATWSGELRTGKGNVSTASGVLNDVPLTFGARFENQPGTNPEELIAAAHAGCYCMAFSNTLTKHGHPPTQLSTRATITLESKPEGGFKISGSHLEVHGNVPGIDEATFQQIAKEAEQGCPVSNALRAINITVDAHLVNNG
jgi:osmotically inducible protein OsmC